MEKGHITTQYVQKFQLETPQISHNLFGPSAQISQLFGIFIEKKPHHMSIVHDLNITWIVLP